jgi:hypothetical protein
VLRALVQVHAGATAERSSARALALSALARLAARAHTAARPAVALVGRNVHAHAPAPNRVAWTLADPVRAFEAGETRDDAASAVLGVLLDVNAALSALREACAALRGTPAVGTDLVVRAFDATASAVGRVHPSVRTAGRARRSAGRAAARTGGADLAQPAHHPARAAVGVLGHRVHTVRVAQRESAAAAARPVRAAATAEARAVTFSAVRVVLVREHARPVALGLAPRTAARSAGATAAAAGSHTQSAQALEPGLAARVGAAAAALGAMRAADVVARIGLQSTAAQRAGHREKKGQD